MAKINLIRTHQLSFLEARKLAQSWMVECEQKYDLYGQYSEGETFDLIEFSRKGLSGMLTITDSQFELDLTLGFLFSAYKNKIVAQIHANMDASLN